MFTKKEFMSQAPKLTLLALTYLLTLTLSFNALAQDTTSSEGASANAELVPAGESLFKSNCTQCHAIHEKVIGPALKNVSERRDQDWLIAWIKNSQKLIQSGDETAVALYNEYNKVAMPAYPFSDQDVNAILAYISAESAKEPVQQTAAAPAGDAAAAEGETGDSVSSGYLTAVLIVLIIVLVLILFVLGLIVSVLTKYLKDKKDLDEEDIEIVNQRTNAKKVVQSDFVLGAVVFIFVALILKTLIDGAFTIGVQQGYMPTQPIAFSHKLHAGQYEIDCNYCHTGVRKSKAANIPSPNICMNCHSAIQNIAGQSGGVSAEIQKIYDAIDYDPSTGEYGTETKPIEWIRVHNLPDLAYFNHSQHVKVGGIECQTCHGPIQEMDVVYQYSTLTMGWCINCHRETNVNTKDNEYYTRLVELHAQHSKEPLKVQDIGGLECSKCHY